MSSDDERGEVAPQAYPRLRGRVTISQTVPTGPYRSVRVQVMEEYFIDNLSFEDKLENLATRLHSELVNLGVVRR
jgi:hypothetical protein